MNKRQRYQLGMSAYNAGRYSEAIEHLRLLAAVEGHDAKAVLSRFYLGQAHYRLAVSLFEQRRFQDATIYFQAAASINPLGGGFARFLTACYVGTGRLDLAIRELETLLPRDPDDSDVRIRLALAQYKQSQPVAAMATLREGVRRQPDDAELNYQLGVLLAADDDLVEAERQFEMTLRLDPSHAGAYERLAQCCGVNHRHERALRYLEKAHHLDPSNTRVALQLSVLAQSPTTSGTLPAVDWRPGPCPHTATRLDTEAIERLANIIIQEPDFVEAFLALPVTEQDGEIFSDLAAILEQALARHPEYADLHHHCGEIYRRLGRGLDAIAHAERAVQINPQYVKALILLAELYGQTERYHDAVHRLEQAVRAGADYPDVHYLIGEFCKNGRHLDRARQAYQRALDLNTDYQAAREALAMLPA